MQGVLEIYILMHPGSQRLEIIIVWFSVFWFLIKVTIQCELEVRHQRSFLPKEILIDVNENTGFRLTFALREHMDTNNSLFSVHGKVICPHTNTLFPIFFKSQSEISDRPNQKPKDILKMQLGPRFDQRDFFFYKFHIFWSPFCRFPPPPLTSSILLRQPTASLVDLYPPNNN